MTGPRAVLQRLGAQLRAEPPTASGKRPSFWLCAHCGNQLDADACRVHGLDVEGRRLRALEHLAAREVCGCELCERAAYVWAAEGAGRGRGEYEAACLAVVDDLWPLLGAAR